MSELHEPKGSVYFSAGVFKLDSMSAGFPEISEIVKEWSKDENFYLLLIRKVSKDNYGIEFMYFAKDYNDSSVIKTKYKKELEEKYKEGLYAWDFTESSGDAKEELTKLKKMLFVSKKIDL